MSAVIETFLMCDVCHETFGVDNRSNNVTQQRRSAKDNDWLYSGNKDYCPNCRPVKKDGTFPKKHNRPSSLKQIN